MSLYTAIILFIGFCNSAWLCWVFVMLFCHGKMIIHESNQWMAGVEIALTVTVAGLFIERLFRLKEKRNLSKEN